MAGARRRCCNMPNGTFVVAPALLGTLATLFSAASFFSCRWFLVHQILCPDLDGDGIGDGIFVESDPAQCKIRQVGRGFLLGEFTGGALPAATYGDALESNGTFDYEVCSWITDDDYRNMGQYRALGLHFNAFALVMGTGVSLATWAGCFRRYRKCGWIVMSVFFFAAFLMQTASLAFFAADECRDDNVDVGCQVGEGAIFDMIAAVLWVPCAMACSAMPMVDEDVSKRNSGYEDVENQYLSQTSSSESDEKAEVVGPVELTHVLISEHILPNGEKQVIRKTTHFDGTISKEIVSEFGLGHLGGSGSGSGSVSVIGSRGASSVNGTSVNGTSVNGTSVTGALDRSVSSGGGNSLGGNSLGGNSLSDNSDDVVAAGRRMLTGTDLDGVSVHSSASASSRGSRGSSNSNTRRSRAKNVAAANGGNDAASVSSTVSSSPSQGSQRMSSSRRPRIGQPKNDPGSRTELDAYWGPQIS